MSVTVGVPNVPRSPPSTANSALWRLSHVVVGSPEAEGTFTFFVRGLGFKVSDRIPGVGAFLRCSTDHDNVLVQAAWYHLTPARRSGPTTLRSPC